MAGLQPKLDQQLDSLHPFAPQHKLFRAYDIRGSHSYFTNDFVCAFAQALDDTIEKNTDSRLQKTIVIGYDMRQGSLKIAQTLAAILSQANFRIIWLGLVTTPMMAFWAEQQPSGQQNGVMVTASHSAKHIHGIKWIIDGESPTPVGIQHLYQQMATQPIQPYSDELLNTNWLKYQSCIDHLADPQRLYHQGIKTAVDTIHHSYRSDQAIHSKPLNTIVIDCLNGTTANYAKSLYSQYVDNVITLNDVPNGQFPKGNPDPCEEGRLTELQAAVIEYQADLGLAFDGDGDRVMMVDNQGRIIEPDNLLYLLAKTAFIANNQAPNTPTYPHPEIIFDVKCSHNLPKMLNQMGMKPVMSKTGSSYMRHQMQLKDSSVIFAGELSGHFIYNDGLFINHDDGMYAGVRLIAWLSEQEQSMAQVIDQLPTMVTTADTYIAVTERQSIMQRLIAMLKHWFDIAKSSILDSDFGEFLSDNLAINLPKNVQLSTIDGIRLDFINGFGVIRQSNTSKSLTVRFAGNTCDDLQAIQQYFSKMCQQLDEELAKAIANIQPITKSYH